jgi:hypothetical protein
MYMFSHFSQVTSWLQPHGLMWKLTTNDGFVSAKLTLIEFGFCTDNNSSDVLIVGSTPHQRSLMLGWVRLALRGMVDSKSGAPVTLSTDIWWNLGWRDLFWSLPGIQWMLKGPRSSWFLSPKGNYPSTFPFLSRSPPASKGNFILKPLCRGGGVNGFSPSLSLSLN